MLKIFNCFIRNGRIIDGTGNPWYLADTGKAVEIIIEKFIPLLDEGDLKCPALIPGIKKEIYTLVEDIF